MIASIYADATPEFWAALTAALVALVTLGRQWADGRKVKEVAGKVDGLLDAAHARIAQLEADIVAAGRVPPPSPSK